ncbi:MAG: lipopolysaccharide biosynthesis protein [Maribacter dokdonensis]
MSIKNKAITGFSWTIFEGIFSQGMIFIVGIVLARLLTPEDFGIVGIITAIISVANSMVEAGFGSALIRKVSSSENDFNTVFYTNLLTSGLLYLFLFMIAPSISAFFESAVLENLIKVSGIVLIINAIALIQQTLLTKSLNFKKLGLIAVISSSISGIISIYLAYAGHGIWSLIVLFILRPLISTILLWVTTKWFPSLKFSTSSFKELFNYGYKVLLGNLISTAYKNLYYFIIGKYFSPASLGYYTRADQFQSPLSVNITAAIRRISFPILANYQNDKKVLKNKFVQFIRFSMYINFTIMLALAAIANPLINILIGDKWEQSIIYLQLLCIPGLLYPLQIMHLNLLLVKGYSNLNLKLEIIKKIILIPILLYTVSFGILAMIYGLIFFSILEYFINSYYTKKIIDYSPISQFKDSLPFLSIALITSLSMFILTFFINNKLGLIITQLIVGFIVFIIVNEIIKLKEYFMIKQKLSSLLRKLR